MRSATFIETLVCGGPWLTYAYTICLTQDLISKLLERKPAKRLGMLNARANDIKNHKWFEGMSWDELGARRIPPTRKPKESDSSKRLKVGWLYLYVQHMAASHLLDVVAASVLWRYTQSGGHPAAWSSFFSGLCGVVGVQRLFLCWFYDTVLLALI